MVKLVWGTTESNEFFHVINLGKINETLNDFMKDQCKSFKVEIII